LDRDPRAPLFRFKTRTVVHFAADSDEVHMTTRLRWHETHFLPFNRGSHPGEVQCGAGNPQHPSGYRTGYFWEDRSAGSYRLYTPELLDVLKRIKYLRDVKNVDSSDQPLAQVIEVTPERLNTIIQFLAEIADSGSEPHFSQAEREVGILAMFTPESQFTGSREQRQTYQTCCPDRR
jgi:hypothetical protein